MDIEARAKSFEEALRRSGVRITRQRAALLRVLAGAEDHPDATQLHARATEAGAAAIAMIKASHVVVGVPA